MPWQIGNTKIAWWNAGTNVTTAAKSADKEEVTLWGGLSHGEIQNDGNDPTPYNNKRVPRAFYKASIK